MPRKRMKRLLRSHWKEIMSGFEEVFGGKEVVFKSVRRDPSLRSQLYERINEDAGLRLQSYLDACKKAPYASASTKRKWKEALFTLKLGL